MFKDHIANDIERTFLNSNEFAEEVNIDGKPIKVVLDNEAADYKGNRDEMERGIGNILLYVNKETWLNTYGREPLAYDALSFNRIPCTIMRVTERNGMYSITLDYTN
jgi:hypothetical protein